MSQLGSSLDLTGMRSSRLVALRRVGRDANRNITWLCRCDCGTEIEVVGRDFKNRHTQSCGCLQRDKVKARNKASATHGQSNRSPTYSSWSSMKTRCTNPNHHAFEQYSKRGVCQRWLNSFENFLEDMGERPEGTSLDRIDNDKGYEPGNCRWATRSEQNRNK